MRDITSIDLDTTPPAHPFMRLLVQRACHSGRRLLPRHPSLSTREDIRILCGQSDTQFRVAASPSIRPWKQGLQKTSRRWKTYPTRSHSSVPSASPAPDLTAGAVDYTNEDQVPDLQEGRTPFSSVPAPSSDSLDGEEVPTYQEADLEPERGSHRAPAIREELPGDRAPTVQGQAYTPVAPPGKPPESSSWC